jgi:hypothetical protein
MSKLGRRLHLWRSARRHRNRAESPHQRLRHRAWHGRAVEAVFHHVRRPLRDAPLSDGVPDCGDGTPAAVHQPVHSPHGQGPATPATTPARKQWLSPMPNSCSCTTGRLAAANSAHTARRALVGQSVPRVPRHCSARRSFRACLRTSRALMRSTASGLSGKRSRPACSHQPPVNDAAAPYTPVRASAPTKLREVQYLDHGTITQGTAVAARCQVHHSARLRNSGNLHNVRRTARQYDSSAR